MRVQGLQQQIFPYVFKNNDSFTVSTSVRLYGFVEDKFKKRLVRFCDLIPS